MIRRYGHVIIFLAGFYVLPRGRARQLYALGWLGLVGGFFLLGQHTNADGLPPVGMDWWQTYYLTPWAIASWAAGVLCTVLMFVEVARLRRAAAQEPVEVPEPVSVPEPEPAAPRTPAEAYVPITERMEEHRSKLIIVDGDRRVRRGGETLSGVPIKDRRAVDPRTL